MRHAQRRAGGGRARRVDRRRRDGLPRRTRPSSPRACASWSTAPSCASASARAARAARAHLHVGPLGRRVPRRAPHGRRAVRRGAAVRQHRGRPIGHATGAPSTGGPRRRLEPPCDDVEGWLSDGPGAPARRRRPGSRRPAQIVEIGSFRGRSTIVPAAAAAPGVDSSRSTRTAAATAGRRRSAPEAARGDADHEVFHANLRGARASRARAHVRRMSRGSARRGGRAVDLLYVDGAHRYAPARADIERVGRRGCPGGPCSSTTPTTRSA